MKKIYISQDFNSNPFTLSDRLIIESAAYYIMDNIKNCEVTIQNFTFTTEEQEAINDKSNI